MEEFTNGPNSGWMYRLNGKIANTGYAQRELQNGDSIIWMFTDDYTQEKDYESYEPWSGNTPLPKPETEGQTIQPTVTVENGTASTTIKESQLSEAIASAQKNRAKSIAISLENTENVRRAEISLPVSAIRVMASESKLLLTVEAPQGTVEPPYPADSFAER